MRRSNLHSAGDPFIELWTPRNHMKSELFLKSEALWEIQKGIGQLQINHTNVASGFKIEWEQKNFATRLNPALIHINFSIR